MLKPIKLTEAIGKKISAVAFSRIEGQCVIVLDDECFATLGVNTGDDGDERKVADDQIRLLDFGDDELIRVGVATRDDIDVRRQEMTRFISERRDLHDRKEYERLKKKFGEA